MFRQEELTSTKLRVIVQHYPDGPGLYGLQVRVSCKGVRSYVAGTTDRDGRFNCELPVRVRSGLTYDVDVTWPREEGGETERKSITLHADRTHFDLPFGGAFSKDDFETGTRAAAFGGTTTIIDFAVQTKGEALRPGLETWMAKAEGKASIDYGFHMIMGDVNEATLKEMDTLVAGNCLLVAAEQRKSNQHQES